MIDQDNAHIVEALRANIGPAGLNSFFGPAAVHRRVAVLSAICRRKVSQREAGWNRFRSAVLGTLHINGSCIADSESQFDALFS